MAKSREKNSWIRRFRIRENMSRTCYNLQLEKIPLAMQKQYLCCSTNLTINSETKKLNFLIILVLQIFRIGGTISKLVVTKNKIPIQSLVGTIHVLPTGLFHLVLTNLSGSKIRENYEVVVLEPLSKIYVEQFYRSKRVKEFCKSIL